MQGTRYAGDAGTGARRQGTPAGETAYRAQPATQTQAHTHDFSHNSRVTIWQKTTINIEHTYHTCTGTLIHSHTHTLHSKLLSILYGFNWQLAAFEFVSRHHFCSTCHWQDAWHVCRRWAWAWAVRCGLRAAGYGLKWLPEQFAVRPAPGAYLAADNLASFIVVVVGISTFSFIFPFFFWAACCGCLDLKPNSLARCAMKVVLD